MLFKLLLIFALSIFHVESARILIVQSSISKSHVIPLQTLAKALAERGHEITFVSSFPLGKSIKNYREITIEFDDHVKDFMKEYLNSPNSMNAVHSMKMMPQLIGDAGNSTLQSKQMRKIMDEESFDLVIIGYFFTEFLLGLGDHFKCPTVVFSSFGLVTSMAQMTGNPLGIPVAQHVGFIQGEDGFKTRLVTFLLYTMEKALTKFMFEPMSKKIYDFNFPSDRYRSYDESIRNVSLLLLNTHFSSTKVRPYLQNVVEVGGIQIKEKPSPLPEDLQKFLDDAKHGAILFSLGSNIKSNYLSEETLKILLKTFKQIKQRVVMKWESDVLEGKPDNVFISKWLPQDDVLAHKSMKAFISHCGYGGVIEAKHHGVPIIGLPIFADQPGNAEKVANEGWGIRIDLTELTEEKLLNSIKEITTNPSYSETVKRLSELTKDRPMHAKDTAVYWVEYVIRHHGAPHLHYPAADLNFIQDNSLDLIAVIIFTAYAAFKVIKFLIMKMCRLCCRKKNNERKIKSQ